MPLITPATLERMLSVINDNQIALLTIEIPDPTGYGRIVRDADSQIQAIVEQQDASPEQLEIGEVNTGVMGLTDQSIGRLVTTNQQ